MPESPFDRLRQEYKAKPVTRPLVSECYKEGFVFGMELGVCWHLAERLVYETPTEELHGTLMAYMIVLKQYANAVFSPHCIERWFVLNTVRPEVRQAYHLAEQRKYKELSSILEDLQLKLQDILELEPR